MRHPPMALDADDFARLYDRHAAELLAFFARRTYDPDAAVDLLGETFASAFQDRACFRGEASASAVGWLYGIARHRLVDYQRRARVQRRAMSRLGVERRSLTDEEFDRIEELALTAELRRRVAEQLAALPAEHREVLRLRVIDERSYADVAAALGISEQTARARASRALKKLRESPILADLVEAEKHA
jgi:RNA polymerase sigma factor (sigma-70 family)